VWALDCSCEWFHNKRPWQLGYLTLSKSHLPDFWFASFPAMAAGNIQETFISYKKKFWVSKQASRQNGPIARFIRGAFVNDQHIDKKSPNGAMANDGQSKFETSQISEGSRNNHQTLPWSLGLLSVKFLVRKQIIWDKHWTNKEPHNFHSSSFHKFTSKGILIEPPCIKVAYNLKYSEYSVTRPIRITQVTFHQRWLFKKN